MAKLPWFRFEATTWLSDPEVRLMTSQQRGWYIDMLCWAWQEGGFKPNAIAFLVQSKIDIDECDNFKTMREEFEEVLAHFTFDCGDGRVSHPKLEENRAEVADKSKKASESANRRWRNADASSPQSDGNASALLRASKSISNSSSVSQEGGAGETKPKLLPKGYAFDEQYKTFREACANLGMAVIESDFTNGAWHEWCSLDPEQRQAAIAGIEARLEAGVDPQMVPRPQKYLVNREWKRSLKTATKTSSALDQIIAEERLKRAN